MKERSHASRINWSGILSFCLPLLLFWMILSFRILVSFNRYFSSYSTGLFLVVLMAYYLSFRLPRQYGVLACLGFTMLLVALTLSYKWTSGFSDNQMMGGLVPYKDGKYYYMGSNLILNGLPPLNANQSTERPLFPSFFASILLLTGQNLKAALALTVQLAGIGIYLSVRQFYKSFGALGSGLYATFLYFYVQPLIGYTMSEMLGFTMGCLGFAMILSTADSPKWKNLILGGLLLMVGVSARAGTFIVFPMLALWIGWIFRGEKRFSVKMAVYAFGTILLMYLLVNTLYSRVLGLPPGKSFGNFSYALYGQARGGAGWYSAIEEVGTRDPSVVYRATLKYFLKHPISLFIGFAKSYRDFFLIGDMSIFPFGDYGAQNLPGVILWFGTLSLVAWGAIQLAKDIRSNVSSLLIAGFIGIFLSIPFLPPIDGGSRFYASTTPFFFALPSVGLALISKKMLREPVSRLDLTGEVKTGSSISIALIFMTLIVPLMMVAFNKAPQNSPPLCSLGQLPFAIQIHPDSYIDLYKKGSAQCGSAPGVCFDDFERNNTEMSTDDFYQELFRLSENGRIDVRIVPAIDGVKNKFHYFYITRDKLPRDFSHGMLSGCAVEIKTMYQTIYKVESIFLSSE
jgi:hypothetical protein